MTRFGELLETMDTNRGRQPTTAELRLALADAFAAANEFKALGADAARVDRCIARAHQILREASRRALHELVRATEDPWSDGKDSTGPIRPW